MLESMFAFGVKLIISDHVGDFNSSQGGRRSSERLVPFYLARQTLDEAVVMPDEIVHFVFSGFVRSIFVDDVTVWRAVRAKCSRGEVCRGSVLSGL